MIQIVDYSTLIHTLGAVDSVVTPLCSTPPPAPTSDAFDDFAEAAREIYGVEIPALDQKDLGLAQLDVVLLYAQLPLRQMWLARIMPHCDRAYGCVSARPHPVLAAIATASRGALRIAVDLRFGGTTRLGPLLNYALPRGIELQLIVTRPLELPGDVIFHSSTPPYIRLKYIKAGGDISLSRGPTALEEAKPQGGVCPAPDFATALGRVAETLGVGADLFAEILERGIFSGQYIADLLTPRQLAYLVKWDLLQQVPGGWAATLKLAYLYGIYKTNA